jgi:hypothetical protein
MSQKLSTNSFAKNFLGFLGDSHHLDGGIHKPAIGGAKLTTFREDWDVPRANNYCTASH